MNKSHANKKLNQLPSWLWTNSTTLPPVYKMVWEAVREDRVRSNGMQAELLVDTNKVFPLLLTSQLPTEVLGHIWNLANQKYAGQLTEQELYIVLALVAAAQTSYTFNSLDILHLLPFPPTPYLNIECLMNLQPATQANTSKLQHYEEPVNSMGVEGKYIPDVKGKTKVRVNAVPDATISFSGGTSGKLACFDGKIHVPGGSNVNNLFKEVRQNLRVQADVPSSFDESCDEFTEFQSAPIPSVSTMSIWDSKQGSAIGSRLANHNLGVKKTVDKVKKAAVGTKAVHINTQIRTSAPASLPYQSKDQSIVESTSDLFPKCGIKNQSKTVILKDTVIRNNDTPKDYSDSFNNLAGVAEPVSNDKEVLPKMEFGPKAVTVEMSDSVQQDLMSLQQVEDKYSALRELVQETSVVNDTSLDLTVNNQSADEFGEFMSAEQPSTNPSISDTLDIESFNNMFAGFEFKTHANADNNNLTDLNFVSEVSETFNNLKLDDGIEAQLVETGKNVQKEDAISINSIELISGPSEALPRSGSVPSLDLKSFLPSNVEEDQITEAPQQTVVYWEWKQYMESCVLLLQVAANIFSNITSELVLQEVLNSVQGYNFLCQLAEVAAVCRRVNFSYKELDINIVGFDDLLMDIDRIWAEMEPFYANIPIVTELPAWPLHQGECVSCSLCLTVITSGRVVYNDNNYHVTCANLWLNCVNNQLPVMRYSLICQSTICPGSHI